MIFAHSIKVHFADVTLIKNDKNRIPDDSLVIPKVLGKRNSGLLRPVIGF